jgi:replicative superfamily II helicase
MEEMKELNEKIDKEINDELAKRFSNYYITKNNGRYDYYEDAIRDINRHFTFEEFEYISKNIDTIVLEFKYNQRETVKRHILLYEYEPITITENEIEEENEMEDEDSIDNLQLTCHKEDTIDIFDDWDFKKNGELTFNKYCKIKDFDYGNTYKKYVKMFGLLPIKIKITKMNLKYLESLVE